MNTFDELYNAGDRLMRSGNFTAASECFCNAWNQYAEQRKNAAVAGIVSDFDATHPPTDAFWLLMSGANAQFCAGDFAGCFDTGVTAHNLFKSIGLIAGNPFFHLRIGQASYELDTPGERENERGPPLDNLARALICGGIEIFAGENGKYLEAVLAVLRPPQGYMSWHDAKGEGCSMEKLNGARGFLCELFAAKYGQPPPYPPP